MTALNEVYAEARASGEVNAEAALKARRAVYGSGSRLSPNDIDMLLKIEEATDRADPAWETLLTEATVDHLVHEREPQDELNEAKVAWLLDRIVADGKVKTARDLEVLIKVIEEAESAPEPLVVLALKQVSAAVIEGEGPLAGIADLDPGRVTREETAIVRRILYAFGGYGGLPITRAEAEVIFDINDAAKGNNDPEWADLFVKTIANCILSASGFKSPPREVALAEDDLRSEEPTGVGGFFASLAVQGLHGILDTYTAPTMAERARTLVSEDDRLVQGNAAWLAERIGRNGTLDENEKALLRFIRDEAPVVDPALMDLIAKAA